jgi:hypothetical protein
MADISKVDSLDGLTTYNIKDAAARALLDGHSAGKDVPSDAVFTDTTYSVATTSANGLMSASDKTKLDAVGGIIVSDTEPSSSEPLIWIDTDDSTSDVIPTSAGDLGLASFVGITLTTVKTIATNE